MKRNLMVYSITAMALFATVAFAAPFREYPIGEEVEKNQLFIAAVWLPPIRMEGRVADTDDLKKDKKGEWIHIEADIHAAEGNENGFGAGEWIPDLRITYSLVGNNSEKIEGRFIKMVAKDGPHYGAQVFLPYGRYGLSFKIFPPDSAQLGRHTDPITGVAPWWKPFVVKWDFNFNGVPKGK